nr:unnamed protein product [Digitaria exilis]
MAEMSPDALGYGAGEQNDPSLVILTGEECSGEKG